ncbi:MAG: type II CRISPR RNA-guided endonuclease Cas9, partial [Clostridia bacterium]
MELSMFQTYKSIKNMFLKEKQNIDWILDIDVYNKIMDYVNLAPGVVELCKMIENDTSLNKKFNKEELDIIKDIKVKKNKDFQYHALSLTVLKKAINDMLKYEMNFQQVSNKLDYGKEAREFFIKNYTKSDAGLPLIESRFIDDIIASPQVKKSLRQAIKIINAIIKEKQYYPDVIAVESTKEMNGKEVKQMISSEQRVLEAIRKDAEKTLSQNFDIDKLTNANIEKVMLYKETNGHCIYCNKVINLNDVVNNSLEVEHILPISKSFDNSYNNKTISCKDCNDKKGNKTPYNYLNSYGLFDEFEKRVLELKMPQYKKNNLLLKGDIEKYSKKFINRNLRDTAYATKELINQIKLFNNYLESIRDIKIKTLSTPGQLTHDLRDKYKLDKNRNDGLYHHAVDASIVSAISNSSIGKLIIESQNDSKFWINNKNIENQIEKLQNASLDKSIDSIRIINNDNILVSSQTIKNPQGKLSNANMYKIIKKEDNYYKIDQIDNIYEFDFNKNRSKFEKLLNEDDKTITLLCFDKDKKLFKLIKDIYLEFKDSKINPFVDYALEKNNITDVKDFNI